MPDSPWITFARKLAGQAGNITGLVSGVASGFIRGSTLDTLAAMTGLRADQYRMQADWTLGGLAAARLQEDMLDINADRAKAAIYEKWNYRYGAAKSSYAARGIAVTSASPLAVAAELLRAANEEIGQVAVDRAIAQWNRVSVPVYAAKSRAVQQRLAADMAEIDAEAQRSAANVTRTTGILGGLAKAVDIAGSFF